MRCACRCHLFTQGNFRWLQDALVSSPLVIPWHAAISSIDICIDASRTAAASCRHLALRHTRIDHSLPHHGSSSLPSSLDSSSSRNASSPPLFSLMHRHPSSLPMSKLHRSSSGTSVLSICNSNSLMSITVQHAPTHLDNPAQHIHCVFHHRHHRR